MLARRPPKARSIPFDVIAPRTRVTLRRRVVVRGRSSRRVRATFAARRALPRRRPSVPRKTRRTLRPSLVNVLHFKSPLTRLFRSVKRRTQPKRVTTRLKSLRAKSRRAPTLPPPRSRVRRRTRSRQRPVRIRPTALGARAETGPPSRVRVRRRLLLSSTRPWRICVAGSATKENWWVSTSSLSLWLHARL